MKRLTTLAEVKAVDSQSPNGEFEVILSTPTLDRDGEVIDAKAFEPLPESIPFHAFHDFSDPVGRAVPVYEGDRLIARGFYASTPRAQEIRTLVAEGVIGHTSVGFMPPQRSVVDGVPHITSGELLEGSFVSVPSNREAAVLLGKAYEAKARGERERQRKSIAGSFEERSDLIRNAVRELHPEAWWTSVLATFDDAVVFEVETMEGQEQYQAPYSITDGVLTLGTAEPVTVSEVVTPKAAPVAHTKSPASAGLALAAALVASAELLLVD